ncbi:hypothetical protein K402DRAFT_274486 [Aulographum hederae CBS 113979]|uniref:Zn(2)-C6 fungal-type domain-containing protein n=1 Tax=Aulographum hederae CBS 113979 TaxID=1176131 RepID=A0A6G1H8P4_9PEZI|nr:hypothetical protein K402DRAFT_274486 [Aulographum hederae CBS 113979]
MSLAVDAVRQRRGVEPRATAVPHVRHISAALARDKKIGFRPPHRLDLHCPPTIHLPPIHQGKAMGRRPSALITEFFERGQKLENSSNRYAWDCKSCGLKFPKGRFDSLQTHLLKTCPVLSSFDRQRAKLYIESQSQSQPQSHPRPHQPTFRFGDDTIAGAARHGEDMQLHLPLMDLPCAQKSPPGQQHDLSALETLAEVSRQHLDLSDKRDGSGNHATRSVTPRPNASQGYEPDDFLVPDDKPSGVDESMNHDKRLSIETTNGPSLPSIQYYGSIHNHTSESPHLPSLSLPPASHGSSAQAVPSPLQLAASAANDLMIPHAGVTMEPEIGVSNVSISDKFFHPTGRHAWPGMSVIDPQLQLNDVLGQQLHEALTGRAASATRSSAGSPSSSQMPFINDFNGNPKPAKQKVRGRFTDSRRKEVQEVRKRGACLRCKMLKKPCSGDNPCSTCVSVESARLWKQPCIRTRLAEEFNLYSAGLYAVLAFHSINQVKSQVLLDPTTGRIEATHFPETLTFATFPILCSPNANGPGIDPFLLQGRLSGQEFPQVQILHPDFDDIGGKLEHYIQALAPSFVENEASAFMKPTLRQAYALTANQKPDDPSLLSKVLELWCCTVILASPNQIHLFSNPSQPPVAAPATLPIAEADSDHSDTHRTRIIPTDGPFDSHSLIMSQILGGTEKRAGNLSKFIMNDLERRSLLRQQANQFETFLVAVIFLSCVERMCWLFKTWEADMNNPSQNEDSTQPRDGSPVQPSISDELQQQQQLNGHPGNSRGHFPNNTNHSPNTMPGLQAESHKQPNCTRPPQPHPYAPHPTTRWPLDKPPQFYSQQGERFSDILHMVLKMRGVPPKTIVIPTAPPSGDDARTSSSSTLHAEGGNAADEGAAAPGEVIVALDPESDPQAAEWYRAVGVSRAWLRERREGFERGFRRGEWECWEGGLVGKILGGS